MTEQARADGPSRGRARDLGIPLEGDTGRWNAITDVPGVEVGYQTLIDADGALRVGHGPVRTGVTAILPLGRAGVGRSCPAGWYSLNGNGEMTGTAWLDEVGGLSLPIAITNTHAVGPAHRGVIEWSLRTNPALAGRWHLPVVAETFDGYLNDIDGRHVSAEVTMAALDIARSGPVDEGSVGGGTGMNCYSFKCGTGTASRRVRVGGRPHTVATLVQANFGSRKELVIAGHRVGGALTADNPIEDSGLLAPGSGSCIAIVATDVPLLPAQCKALARRVPLGLARTGTTGSHFSGDLFLAFSATNVGMLDSSFDTTPGQHLDLPSLTFVPWAVMDVLYEAVVQCIEESVLNALVAARSMTGRDGHRSPGFPHERVAELLTL